MHPKPKRLPLHPLRIRPRIEIASLVNDNGPGAIAGLVCFLFILVERWAMIMIDAGRVLRRRLGRMALLGAAVVAAIFVLLAR